MVDKSHYYIIPNELYLLDGTEVRTVKYSAGGATYWRYLDNDEVHSGKLGVNLFLKNPCEPKVRPLTGYYIRSGCKVKLFNLHTKEIGYYVLVRNLGDTNTISPIKVEDGKYYGELAINSVFGQELHFLQKNDFAVYYLPNGAIKYYRVEDVEAVRGLYVSQKINEKAKKEKKKKATIKPPDEVILPAYTSFDYAKDYDKGKSTSEYWGNIDKKGLQKEDDWSKYDYKIKGK